jgi:hypothetical protein
MLKGMSHEMGILSRIAGCLMVETSSFATGIPRTDSVESNRAASEVIVQIFGRMCEYHREDVETALRAFNRWNY